MKRFNKLLCFLLVFITVMAAFCAVSFAATVGQPLKNPESGWKRINASSETFGLIGEWESGTNSLYFDGDFIRVGAKDTKSYITFKFYGTKFRILGCQDTLGHSTINEVIADGIKIGSFSQNGNLVLESCLNFEKTELSLAIHTVTIRVLDPSTYGFVFDAIDIDDNGYLIDYYSPTNLTAVPGNTNVELSWDEVESATSYIVKRSETPGGPYEAITTTSAITYTDRDVTNGTTYYYVVTSIVNGVESDPSNEASATPTAPVVAGNNAILEITMVTGDIKEYDLTAAELQSFLAWYDGRSNGADKAYYVIPKKNNIKPFLSRKEYLAFDKISSFEVREYTD